MQHSEQPRYRPHSAGSAGLSYAIPSRPVNDRYFTQPQTSNQTEATVSAGLGPCFPKVNQLGVGDAPVRLKRTFDFGVPAIAPAPSAQNLRPGCAVQPHFLHAPHQQQQSDGLTSNAHEYSDPFGTARPVESVADTEDFIKAVQPKSLALYRKHQTSKAADGYTIFASLKDKRGMFCLDAVPCCSGPFTDNGQCLSATLGGTCCCKVKLPLQQAVHV